MAKKKIGISRDLLIHPGETIADVLEDRGITQAELAMRTGVTPAYVSNVINGKKDISAKFAMALEYALGVKKSFWLNLQANYDSELLELNEVETVTEAEIEARGQLNAIVKYLRSKGLMPVGENKEDSILSLRNVLKMSDISNLPKIANAGAFRMSESTAVNPYVLGAWIRMCQIIGEKKNVSTVFDKNRIPELITGLKAIMLKHDGNIQNDLTRIMDEYGIDFYIIHHFTGAPVHGYVSMKRDGSYQIIVTIRRAFADEFWFSLFHELGHLVNGDVDQNSRFVDDGTDIAMEEAANRFASNALLDEMAYKDFVSLGDFSLNAIKSFSSSQGVMPYIVIGRLKRERKLEYYQYSDQMLRYKWKE